MRIVLACALLLAISLPAKSQDFPGRGIVYGVTEKSSLTFECKVNRSSRIECEFAQASVRPKQSKDQLEKALEKARSEFTGLSSERRQKQKSDSCALADAVLGILDGKISIEKPEALAAFPQGQRADLRAMGEAMRALCRNYSLENFVSFARLQFDRECRTCSIAANTFKQTFQRQIPSGIKAWIAVSEPNGPCGVVQLDRFEQDTSSQFGFWKYFARKAVTNPRGESLLIPCDKLDQAEYEYDWRTREIYLNCDYIEFSPF